MKHAVLFLAILAGCSSVPQPDRELTGVITTEGVTCPAMRGDDGKIYTLASDREVPPPGTRVRVTGTTAETSICMQGTTISVDSIETIR